MFGWTGRTKRFDSIDPMQRVALVHRYVQAMETEKTKKWCKCEWIIHPDDVEKAEGQRRVRPGESHPECPVHTREGFLLHFFDWAEKHA